MKYYDKEGNPQYVQFDTYHGRYTEINAFALHNIDVSLRRIAKSLEAMAVKTETQEVKVEPKIVCSRECPLDAVPIVDRSMLSNGNKIIENENV